MILKTSNALPKKLEDDIEKLVMDIPYYYSSNTSYGPDDPFLPHYLKLIENSNVIENGQFTHALLNEGKIASELYGLIYPVLYIFAEKNGIVVNQITRAKVNLLLKDKSFTKDNYNFPHSDRGMGEKVFIYYINDSDGDTVIFNEFDTFNMIPDNFTIADRVTPKKGSGVFFDCSRFHASSNPAETQHRFVINFNFI